MRPQEPRGPYYFMAALFLLGVAFVWWCADTMKADRSVEKRAEHSKPVEAPRGHYGGKIQ